MKLSPDGSPLPQIWQIFPSLELLNFTLENIPERYIKINKKKIPWSTKKYFYL